MKDGQMDWGGSGLSVDIESLKVGTVGVVDSLGMRTGGLDSLEKRMRAIKYLGRKNGGVESN